MTTSDLQPKKGEIIVNKNPEMMKKRKRIAAILPTLLYSDFQEYRFCVPISFNRLSLTACMQENLLRNPGYLPCPGSSGDGAAGCGAPWLCWA
jgi:hypothetical protein